VTVTAAAAPAGRVEASLPVAATVTGNVVDPEFDRQAAAPGGSRCRRLGRRQGSGVRPAGGPQAYGTPLRDAQLDLDRPPLPMITIWSLVVTGCLGEGQRRHRAADRGRDGRRLSFAWRSQVSARCHRGLGDATSACPDRPAACSARSKVPERDWPAGDQRRHPSESRPCRRTDSPPGLPPVELTPDWAD
jgi:hypothetical protein